MPVVSLAELLESGVHFGHQTRRWNPKMSQYIYTARNGVHIIDLVQTAQLIEEAYEFVRGEADSGKRFLFIGTKRQAAAIIKQEALRSGSHFVNQRWLGGMLTNWETIRGRVERLKELEELENSGALDKRPKKEASVLRRELGKLEKYLGGIKTMRRLPDLVIVVDQRREYNAIQECQKLGIPIISLLDTNCDPDLVDVPIPANDDAIRSVKLILGKISDAIIEGRRGGQAAVEEYEEDYDNETEYEEEGDYSQYAAEFASGDDDN
ncbi:MAG: 30S ribosomal protein S2 [Microcystis panniformis Mp_MB_F_20051200_S9]|jgi:small subunit ribosomal protein S2|uniref:Small ribosomal subunit protein uS2 n=6 Tax=Microcystis TaxID=1125 RepID=S3JDH2_MICAE|nr:30S ribosomal protein S2 [Microcystis aeruginosa]MCU7244769.1 30S ribosomal protein S2 [Microcystis aeruginosa WS75]MCZ8188681.1 30S ribosomal protein S2 [Microcystis sp. LE19-338.1B]MCZ8358838.1 30S ribosomal protein S2 [Microcystis sp. LE19-388.1G]NCQ69919.1 30S ribosomal protein S2 [Microcystis aeruginosa W13-16]NCQ74442.1 30S ribosomal protein S2 [Microcystis aeruginosa W13-13]NCQ78794.1 30S ribosomal protein S2 [Microcystis aeruginosa W13-15]NCR22188.1 30S ribosomal protein S2 [Micro